MFAEGEGPSADVTNQMACEDLGLAKSFGTCLQKKFANPKPSQPHEPKGNDRTKSIFTDFFLVWVWVNNPHSCDMGARVSEPPQTLELPKPSNCPRSLIYL